jgi:hypothetical protein
MPSLFGNGFCKIAYPSSSAWGDSVVITLLTLRSGAMVRKTTPSTPETHPGQDYRGYPAASSFRTPVIAALRGVTAFQYVARSS